ncbi:N(6)-acetyl-beta-lysine transaminase precursor [Phyllobacterium leguminum]|uniref:N(6)-acetyl-beta-lysine transaminase n=2 Tax=Phyllobacterium leguminum TaxID=314237 RepID=A0A318T9Y2_9HYPH|nr:N(6)-acetyl-beta-lysine transaminase precursor [Phyllobacterium leguminum]
MHRLDFVYRTQFRNEQAERLSERLCGHLGYEAAFFVNSGSEAVETAVRMARSHWALLGHSSKTKILSRALSYHGSTHETLSLSGHRARRRDAGLCETGPVLPTPNPLRRPKDMTNTEYAMMCANAVRDEIRRQGTDTVAAVLLEPIIGASGAAMVPPDGYLERVREICTDEGVLLIADEVLTGLGRTGAWLAQDHWSVRADITCLGKGMNGGYLPISAVLVSLDVLDVMMNHDSGMRLGHTHSNHPIAAAAANAVIDVLESDGLIEHAASQGTRFGETLKKLCSDIPQVAEVRGRGMFWGVELVLPNNTLLPFPAESGIAGRLVSEAFKSGLMLYPATGFLECGLGDAVILAPPLNSSLSDLTEMLALFVAALKELPVPSQQKEMTNA